MLFLKNLSFQSLNANTSILIHHRKKKGNIIIMSLYLDNFLLVFRYKSSMVDQTMS